MLRLRNLKQLMMNKAWVDMRSKCLTKKTEVIEAEELLLKLLPLPRILFSPVPLPYILPAKLSALMARFLFLFSHPLLYTHRILSLDVSEYSPPVSRRII